MLKAALLLLFVAQSAPVNSGAVDNPFVGSWRFNLTKSRITDVMKVDNVGGQRYSFNFGGAPETIVLDGTDQPGNLGTTLSVAAVSPTTWKVVRKSNGRVSIFATWNLSADSSTLTDHFVGYNSNGSTFKLDYVYKRNGRGNGFPGEWVSTSEAGKPPASFQLRFSKPDNLSFFYPSTQTTRTTKLDGRDYPRTEPNATPGASSSWRRIDERTLEMTFKVDGRILYTQEIRLSSDLKTMTMTKRNAGQSATSVQVFDKE